ncbi:hypothetical protein ACIQF6_28735 [Kitasatospora sp. NPDC092948]|uniref:hypothetical protein n=1 Tax=Kitasatospora sp. NPDC092948 TaxID=3364088 RepID=UPI00381C3CFC
MSSAAQPKVGRSYTRARRHPWVLGRLGDFRLPMGPYTPPQLIIASVGAFTLIKTVSWWAPALGPFPVVVWAGAIWAARHSRVGGRSFGPAVLDAASLIVAPRGGRIGGRPVRPVAGHWLRGGFGIEEADNDVPVPERVTTPLPQEPELAVALSRPTRPAVPAKSDRGRARRVRTPATTAPPAPTAAGGRRTAPAEAPTAGPVPTALELLLAAASDSTTHDTRGTSR